MFTPHISLLSRWLCWVGFNVLVAMAGMLLADLIIGEFTNRIAWPFGISAVILDVLMSTLAYMFVGVCLGVVQERFAAPTLPMRHWVLTTSIGCGVGSVFFSTLLYPLALNLGWYSDQLAYHRWFWLTGALTLGSVFFITGCGQGFLLWRAGLSGRRWVVVSTVGACIAGLLVGLTFLDADTSGIDWTFAWMVGSLCWSMCTGIVLPASANVPHITAYRREAS